MSAERPKIRITKAGSTNTAALEVTLDEEGKALVHGGTEARQVPVKSSAIAEFSKTLDTAGPLHALPANHCMKSASFGSSLYVWRGDDRSPDLSCPVQSDPRTATLKKQAEEILNSVEKAGDVHRARRVY
jgi:hypothetical protein